MKSKKKTLVEALIYVLLIIVCVWLVPKYVVQRTVVSGESMQDTLQNGESLLVDKVSYHFTDPKRYDIIVFYPKGRDVEEYYVKRIYGLPGETVQITDKGEILINGEELVESYGREVIKDPGLASDPITLGEDEYFVLGDNRNNSADSREPSVGNIQKKDILGRAWLRIWPFDQFGLLVHHTANNGTT